MAFNPNQQEVKCDRDEQQKGLRGPADPGPGLADDSSRATWRRCVSAAKEAWCQSISSRTRSRLKGRPVDADISRVSRCRLAS
jgi:hypothetical protein